MLSSVVKFLTSKPRFLSVVNGMLVSMICLWASGAQANSEALAQPSWPSAWTYRLQAQVSGIRLNINANMEWSVTKDRYQAKLKYSLPLVGHRTQTSQGVWSSQGLSPLVFVESTPRRRTDLVFDWTEKTVTRNQVPYHQGLQLGAQDPLSVFFEMGLRLAQLTSKDPPSSIRMNVVGVRKVENWTFKFKALDTLDLPAGQFTVWHWQRPASDDDKGVSVDLWMAPSLGFLPVRIRLSQPNGDVLDQLLHRLD